MAVCCAPSVRVNVTGKADRCAGSLWGLAKLTVAMRHSVPMAASRVVLKRVHIHFDITSQITEMTHERQDPLGASVFEQTKRRTELVSSQSGSIAAPAGPRWSRIEYLNH